MCTTADPESSQVFGKRNLSEPLLLQRPTNDPEKFLDSEVDNEITLTAFRLLVMDLLVFFHVVNEGVINALGMRHTYYSLQPSDKVRALFRNV